MYSLCITTPLQVYGSRYNQKSRQHADLATNHNGPSQEMLREGAGPVQQVGGSAFFHDAGVAQHDRTIGLARPIETTRDDDGRTAAHQGFVTCDYLSLRRRVERGGRLVENQD